MPTGKTMDDVPITPISSGGVSILAYLEARIRDQKEHSGVELQGLRENLDHFREEAADSRGGLQQLFKAEIAAADTRYQQRFEAQTTAVNSALLAAEKAINAALLASEKAVLKAENASEKRFEAVNEFRSSLNDMVAMMMPRTECDTRFTAQSEKMDLIQQRLDKSEGTGGGLRQGWIILIGAVALISSLVSVFALLSRSQ